MASKQEPQQQPAQPEEKAGVVVHRKGFCNNCHMRRKLDYDHTIKQHFCAKCGQEWNAKVEVIAFGYEYQCPLCGFHGEICAIPRDTFDCLGCGAGLEVSEYHHAID